jgi:hypothetical protein
MNHIALNTLISKMLVSVGSESTTVRSTIRIRSLMDWIRNAAEHLGYFTYYIGGMLLKNTDNALMVPKNFPAQILNVGAWARGSERVPVSLPRELEDFIPEVRQIIAANAVSDQYGGNNYLTSFSVLRLTL